MSHGKACENCSAWEPIGIKAVARTGRCRMRAPTAIGWPETKAEDWCLDFRAQINGPTLREHASRRGKERS